MFAPARTELSKSGLRSPGEPSLDGVEQADRHVSRLRSRIEELQAAAPAAPEDIAQVAVAAAIEELEARGAFAQPEAPKPPARKQAAKPKAA